jgi:hypothetical protein
VSVKVDQHAARKSISTLQRLRVGSLHMIFDGYVKPTSVSVESSQFTQHCAAANKATIGAIFLLLLFNPMHLGGKPLQGSDNSPIVKFP